MYIHPSTIISHAYSLFNAYLSLLKLFLKIVNFIERFSTTLYIYKCDFFLRTSSKSRSDTEKHYKNDGITKKRDDEIEEG